MADKPAIALIWGTSDFLVREEAEKLLEGAHPTVVEGRDWQPGATADLATPSLFGEPRALLVVGAQDLPGEAVEEIARFAPQAEPGSPLVLATVVGSRAKGPPRALAKALGEVALVRRAAVERRDLPGWVGARALEAGISSTPAGVGRLIDVLGEDPAALAQAVGQLASAARSEGVTPRTVDEQFRGLGDRRIWELCDAAFSRNGRGAQRALAGMLRAREEPLAILGGIASRLRDLIRIAALPPQTPPSEVARAAGLRFDWQARRYREQAARFTERELSDLHRDLVEADRALKQGGRGGVVLPIIVARIVTGERAGSSLVSVGGGGTIRARRV